MTATTANDPGDLGRRIREQRERLGMSARELARRAGMAPGYLDYLEARSGANPSAAALTRLAAALDTTIPLLRGGGRTRPPGAGRAAGARPVLEDLDERECRDLLLPGGVGRVVFDDARGPVAFPVNFGAVEGGVVLRTGDGAVATAARSGGRLSFEVDHLDEALGEGWSVLLTGTASVGGEADEVAVPEQAGLPDPWAGGDRPMLVRIAAEELSGRRIRHR